MLIVPLQAVPNQTLAVLLGNQNCRLNVYQKFYGVFLDLFVSNQLIIGGVLCENENTVVKSTYLGFQGDFWFFDTQGNSDPHYTGLGGRYQLQYLEETDILAAVES
jgi:hypothetical protein